MLFFSYDIVLIVYFLCYAVVNVQIRLLSAFRVGANRIIKPL